MNPIKVLLYRFQQCFRPFTVLPVEGSSETGPYRHFSNHIFRSPLFRKYIGYEGHPFFFKIVQNLIQILKMQQKIQKKFFVS